MVSIAVLSTILFGAIFVNGQSVTEKNLHHYLTVIGRISSQYGDADPLQYINNALTGWDIHQSKVNELVGIVCIDRSSWSLYHDHDYVHRVHVEQGCRLFRQVAVKYLPKLVAIPYGESVKTRGGVEVIKYDEIKSMFPIICDSVQRRVPGCDLLKQRAKDFLIDHHRDLTNLNLDTYNQVKEIMPMFCFRENPSELDDVKNLPESEKIQVVSMVRAVCGHFDNITSHTLHSVNTILNGRMDENGKYTAVRNMNQGSGFFLHFGKSFIAYRCLIEPIMLRTPRMACKYLLKDHMELLLLDTDRSTSK